MTFFVGISGGHHESSATVYDSSQNRVLILPAGKPLNPHHLDSAEFSARLTALILGIARTVGFQSIDALRANCGGLVLALPGAGTPKDSSSYHEVLSEIGLDNANLYRVVDDTWVGLYAETRTPWGICAFAGSGASVFVALGSFVATKSQKIDGWGPIIGDFGGAFDLVAEFFRELGRNLDENPDKTPPLFESLRRRFPQIPPIYDVQRWFDYQLVHAGAEWPATFALLGEGITVAAACQPHPDPFAVELVRRSAKDLCAPFKSRTRDFGHKRKICQ